MMLGKIDSFVEKWAQFVPRGAPEKDKALQCAVELLQRSAEKIRQLQQERLNLLEEINHLKKERDGFRLTRRNGVEYWEWVGPPRKSW